MLNKHYTVALLVCGLLEVLYAAPAPNLLRKAPSDGDMPCAATVELCAVPFSWLLCSVGLVAAVG
jgi:hypothetical protein